LLEHLISHPPYAKDKGWLTGCDGLGDNGARLQNREDYSAVSVAEKKKIVVVTQSEQD
jgi:hypothetical protein